MKVQLSILSSSYLFHRDQDQIIQTDGCNSFSLYQVSGSHAGLGKNL